jgi:hypothetical protein
MFGTTLDFGDVPAGKSTQRMKNGIGMDVREATVIFRHQRFEVAPV